MKRVSVLGVVVALCALLLITTVASSATSTRKYTGDIEKGGTVDFTIRKNKRPGRPARSKLIKFVFEGLVVDCQGHPNPETTSGRIITTAPVRNGHFQFRGSNENETASLRFSGDLTGPRKAVGKIRVHGSAVLLDDKTTANCESHNQDWEAHRIPG